jgi:hypothetical protein
MKPGSTLFLAAVSILTVVTSGQESHAQQQYKLRQVTNMMGMKSESTIYVKPMRKRTEGGGVVGMPNNIVTIEQCDKQRIVKLNDKKKLYFIEPFSKDQEEVIDEDVKPAVTKNKPVTTTTQKGGTIHMYYNITDTGERKKMYGFTARRIWTTQKMKPSADACYMKDSMIIKTDGWYIDLPEFNCPIRYAPASTASYDPKQPQCKDKYVTHRSGKGKLGFPLIEKRTMIMGNSGPQTSTYETDLETLELTTGKLDSMLFEIPPGYTLAKSEEELQDKMDMNELIKAYGNNNNDNDNIKNNNNKGVPTASNIVNAIKIGVYAPKGEQLDITALQEYIVGTLTTGKVMAMPVNSEDEARSKKCDYTLSTDFARIKSASKVGGLIKAIKNADPNASSSYNIEASMTLIKLADGSVRLEPKMDGKYQGKPDDAARKVIDEGSRQVLDELQ